METRQGVSMYYIGLFVGLFIGVFLGAMLIYCYFTDYKF